jgi:hypothetical protein
MIMAQWDLSMARREDEWVWGWDSAQCDRVGHQNPVGLLNE